MKFVLIFLSIFNLGGYVSTLKLIFEDPPKTSYQLENNQIIKKMQDPIVITNQGDNLLRVGSYLTQTKLTLPLEDLEYMRSDQISVNLSFNFQFEWWNAREYQVIYGPKITQSMKSKDLIQRPRQIITRLTWPSIYIRNTRPFAHAILFYYDQNFNLMMAHQLESDLVEWEINAASRETKGVPQNYRIRLSNLQLSYPVPEIFENLQTKFLEVPSFYSRHSWEEWWLDFNKLFLNSEFVTINHFDDFLVRPKKEDQNQIHWSEPPHNESKYIDLIFSYQNYDYLKIYQYFFPQPRLKIIYHQYLDLSFEFDKTTLILKSNQNCWNSFKQKHLEWSWWLNHYVEPIVENEKLILKSKDSVLVRGEAKIQLIKQKIDLLELNLENNFNYLQFENKKSLTRIIFNIFKSKNSIIFNNENLENYQILETNNPHQFILKALEKSNFIGSLTLNFKEVKNSKIIKDLPKSDHQVISHVWPFWTWILLIIIIICVIITIFLKFTKSKPPKK